MSQDLRAAQLKIDQLTRVLPIRNDLHLLRKLWHMTSGLILISMYMAGIAQSSLLIALGSFFIFCIVMELIRLRNPSFNERCIRFFGVIIRSNEVDRVSGVPYYVASSFIAIAIFPKPVAVLALFYLALGDPIASLFGVLYSNRSVKVFNGTKSLHGTVAGFVVCALTTWLYLRYIGIHSLNLIRLSLLGGFAGAFSEILPLELDDNFTIPIISGFIVWLGFIAVNFV